MPANKIINMSVMPKCLLCLCLVVVCESKKTGAPPGICDTMTPHHRGTIAQSSTPTFVIEASSVDGTSNSISVKLNSDRGDWFKGFLIQARLNADTDNILDGTFSTTEFTKQSTCKGGMSTYLTHNNNTDKTIVETIWTPPANFEDLVIFRATVVKEFAEYWTGIQSQPILANGSDSLSTTVSSRQTFDNIYSECNVDKGCFGLPNGCVEKSSCTVILSFVPETDYIDFQLIGALKSDGWVAVGFSDNQKMGDDSVTECIYNRNKFTLQQSWNVATPRKNNERINNPQGSIIEKIQQSNENGILTCRWKQAYQTSVRQHTFNLKEEPYYLLLAIGDVDENGVKEGHFDKLISADKVYMTKISSIEGKPSLAFLIKIHGSFMVVAWLALVSVGILLARYYKQVWEGSTLCSTKIWFAFHRAIMVLAVLLIIAAFVAIFIHEDGWSEAYPHSILGCVTTGLVVIQVIVGIARPNPNSSKRPAFNWLHWLNGNCSQILAIITIFFAIELKHANLPTYCYWILIAYIAFHLIFHITMQFHSCCMERKDTNEIKLHQLGQKREMETVRDAPGGGFRRFMLGIYIVVSFGTVIALVLIICLN